MPTKPEAGAKPNTLGSGGPQDVGSMDGKNYDRALEAELDAEIARELAATEEANKMLAQAG